MECNKCGCTSFSKWPKDVVWKCTNWGCNHLQHEDGRDANALDVMKWIGRRLRP